MTETCKTCAKNMDGVCPIYRDIEFSPIRCDDFELTMSELTFEDRVGYDMHYADEADVSEQLSPEQQKAINKIKEAEEFGKMLSKQHKGEE